MSETGFFAQKRGSPTSLGLVILLHAALISAVILVKGPAFQRILHPPIEVTLIEPQADPPVEPPRPQPDQPQRQIEQVDRPEPLTQTNLPGPVVQTNPEPIHIADNSGAGTAVIPQLPPPPPPLVRRAAQIDPSSQLQPPYPPSELRLQRDGRVQVRVTIGPDGRVIDIALVSATSDAFWRVTQQQALHHWRFRPATVDGRPVQETKTMSLVFRIVDQG